MGNLARSHFYDAHTHTYIYIPSIREPKIRCWVLHTLNEVMTYNSKNSTANRKTKPSLSQRVWVRLTCVLLCLFFFFLYTDLHIRANAHMHNVPLTLIHFNYGFARTRSPIHAYTFTCPCSEDSTCMKHIMTWLLRKEDRSVRAHIPLHATQCALTCTHIYISMCTRFFVLCLSVERSVGLSVRLVSVLF